MRSIGLRTRLVVTYTVAAVVLMIPVAITAVQALDHNLRSTLDSALAARATPLVQLLSEAGPPELPTNEPSSGTVAAGLALVLDPAGVVRYADPRAAEAVLAVTPEVRPEQSPALVDRSLGEEKVRLRIDRVARADGLWTVVVGVDRETTEQAAEKVQDVLEIVLPLLLIIVVAGTWLLASAALAPVERMRAEAGTLGAADAEGRLSVPVAKDDLRALAVTFNDLLGRLHHSLERQRDFVADAGHELRTPLAIMSAELELAERPGRSPEELRSAIAGARHEAARLAALADDLLLLASQGRRPMEVVELAGVVDEAIAALRGTAGRADVLLQVTVRRAYQVAGERAALRRALDNLLTNAVAHSPAGGTVAVVVAESAEGIELRVTDTGPGFPPEFLPHAFDRFRRADTARSSTTSTGLGLAIVAAIAATHGGTARAANNPGGPGASVAIVLPRPNGPHTIGSAPFGHDDDANA